MNNDRLKKQLEVDELRSKKIYLDSASPPKWTGGIGRNLTDRGFSDDEIDLMYANDVRMAEADARALVPNFDQLNDVRQEAIVNFVFNLGRTKASQFKKSFALLNAGKFSEAADEFMNSTWAKQVGARSVRITEAIRKG